MSLTLFSIPKPFAGHIAVIQENAIRSWARLPEAQVILFGDEAGLADAAGRIGVRHESAIARNALGTPIVSDAFDRARQLVQSQYLVFVNTDIVFTSHLVRAIDAVARQFPIWVMVGRRHDIDITEPLPDGPDSDSLVLADVAQHGTLHGRSGIDFFAFPRTFPIALPPLAVGRVGWDSWLIYAIRAARIPLVEATGIVPTIHQNHPPAHDPLGAEARHNREAAGGYFKMGSLRDTDWRLIEHRGEIRAVPRLAGRVWFATPVRACLALKRAINWQLGR